MSEFKLQLAHAEMLIRNEKLAITRINWTILIHLILVLVPFLAIVLTINTEVTPLFPIAMGFIMGVVVKQVKTLINKRHYHQETIANLTKAKYSIC